MSNVLPSFASGGNLAIKIGDQFIAYATNLSISRDMAHAGVGGIGSYSYDALEPLQFAARGSFSITRYTQDAMNSIKAGTVPGGPTGMAPKRTNEALSTRSNGNSFLTAASFSPVNLMLSRTFDIQIYERFGPSLGELKMMGRAIDCRLTSYSIGFTPGSLVAENIGFICIDYQDQDLGITFNPDTVTTT